MKFALIALINLIILIAPLTSYAVGCGDANGDDKISLMDVAYIINHLYRGGPELNCGTGTDECGDVNNDAELNMADLIYIVNFLYRHGPEPCGTGTMTDIEGNIYKTIKIGNQWWMAENLKVTHYRNGDSIPNLTDSFLWFQITTGAFCNYGNDENNVALYGRLYNWFAVGDSRNIAPDGWHVPSDAEWQTLVDYLGGETVAGGKMKEAGLEHWFYPNEGATNESNFNALPSGGRVNLTEDKHMGDYTSFWSMTKCEDKFAYIRLLSFRYSRNFHVLSRRGVWSLDPLCKRLIFETNGRF